MTIAEYRRVVIDLLLMNARLTDGSLVHLLVEDGIVVNHIITEALLPPDAVPVDPSTGEPVDAVVIDDLRGQLVLPAAVEPHAHLDKAFTGEQIPNPAGDLMGAIHAWSAAAPDLTVDDIAERATRAIERMATSGITTIRTHVDVGGHVGLRSVEALVRVRADMIDTVDLEIVALIGAPLTGPDGATNRGLLDDAIAFGVDLVGGAPAIDPDHGGAIDVLIDVANEAALPLDLHIDETLDPTSGGLNHLVTAVLDGRFSDAVTASHCVSLGMQAPNDQQAMARRVAQANIGVVTLPQTNLFLQAREMPQAPPRGLTAVDALLNAGVVVAAGADNVQDPFNLVGRADPFETAALLVMAGHQLPTDAYAMCSAAGRTILGRRPAGPEIGEIADLIVVPSPSVNAAVADAPTARRVYRNGQLLARTEVSTELYL